jgi:hypothetical protein
VHLITLQGALERTTEDGSECKSRGLKRSLLHVDLRSITHGLRSITVTETSICEAKRELEKRD